MTADWADHGRLVLLVTTPRVAPGLLTAAAWDWVRRGQVLVADGAHPQIPALQAAGVEVRVVGEVSPARLLDEARAATTVWLLPPGEPDEPLAEVQAEAARRRARREPVPAVDAVTGAHDLPGARLLDLVAVMDRLRSPGGCPWDAEQTHRSLATYLLEETYETLEAIESGDDDDLREELGDLLLQVMFHARIAEERQAAPWSVDDVAVGITDKLVRRHPHVFGDAHAPTAEHVGERWEVLKRAEKQRTSAVEGVPLAQPALSLAAKLLQRTDKAGVEVPVPQVGLPQMTRPDDVGDILLAVAAAARALGVDPEQALRDAVRRYIAAVRRAENTTNEPAHHEGGDEPRT